jgi:hypothetical protein
MPLPPQVIPQAGVAAGLRELYKIETLAERLQLTHAQRGQLRHLRAKPILKRIQRVLWDLRKVEIERGTLFGKLKEALDYAYNNWRRLSAYGKVRNGHIHIGNN